MANRAEIAVYTEIIADLEKQTKFVQGFIAETPTPVLVAYLKSQNDFTDVIRSVAAVRRKRICVDINNSRAHCIEMDESTDISIKSAGAVVFHYEVDGVERQALLFIIELESNTADGIVRALVVAYEQHGIKKELCYGGSFDNCSTMMGNLGGVKVKLKVFFINFELVQGDGAHLWSLGMKDAAKKNIHAAYITELVFHTRNIANYVRKSPKAQRHLHGRPQVLAQRDPRGALEVVGRPPRVLHRELLCGADVTSRVCVRDDQQDQAQASAWRPLPLRLCPRQAPLRGNRHQCLGARLHEVLGVQVAVHRQL